MKKVSFFYPGRFTKKDYRQLLGVVSVYCKYFLLNCTKGDCSDDKIILELEKYKVEKHERLVLDTYKDVDYLFKLNKKTINIILQYSSNIYGWSTQGQPEDICFLDKNKRYWFLSVIHEGYFDFLLTQKDIKLLREEYHSKLCPVKYLNVFPFISDTQTEKLLKIIRGKSLLKYCQFITYSYESTYKTTKRNIQSNRVYRVPTFPRFDKLQDVFKLFYLISESEFDDAFDYFNKDIEKSDVLILMNRLKNIKKDFNKFIHSRRTKSSKYFKNCADVLERNCERLEKTKKISAPWESVLWKYNENEAEKASNKLLKLSENLARSKEGQRGATAS